MTVPKPSGNHDLAERVARVKWARTPGANPWDAISSGRQEVHKGIAAEWLAALRVAGLAVVELPEPDHIVGDVATFPGGHSISTGADPNAVKAWRQHAGVSAAIAAWGEREPEYLDEDDLPLADARRMVPVGPLLELLPELDRLATEAGSCSQEAEVWVRSATDRLCARLDSLLGESPESHAQEDGL